LHRFFGDLAAYSNELSEKDAGGAFRIVLVSDDGEEAAAAASDLAAAALVAAEQAPAEAAPSPGGGRGSESDRGAADVLRRLFSPSLLPSPLSPSPPRPPSPPPKALPEALPETQLSWPGLVELPRWDYEWLGIDTGLALSAGRFVEALARRHLGMDQRPDERPGPSAAAPLRTAPLPLPSSQLPKAGAGVQEASAGARLGARLGAGLEGGLVFQVRSGDAALETYYKGLVAELHAAGVRDFGNQDYTR